MNRNRQHLAKILDISFMLVDTRQQGISKGINAGSKLVDKVYNLELYHGSNRILISSQCASTRRRLEVRLADK